MSLLAEAGVELRVYEMFDRWACSWAEAEAVFPGIEAEWTEMKQAKSGVLLPPADIEVRLELVEWPGGKVLHVIQLDPENQWDLPPEWRRWPGGGWTHPMALPHFKIFDL